jgi:hypothetical protein
MNEKRMKTSVNTGELSSPPAQGACWGVKVRAEHGCGSEKPALGVEKWLEMPREERIITKTTGKAQLNHEHQLKWEIPALNLRLRQSLAKTPKILAPNGYSIF